MARAPAADPGTRPVACTRSTLAPALDALASAYFAMASGFGWMLLEHLEPSDPTALEIAFVAGPATLAVVFGVAAYGGYASAARCRAYAAPMAAATR